MLPEGVAAPDARLPPSRLALIDPERAGLSEGRSKMFLGSICCIEAVASLVDHRKDIAHQVVGMDAGGHPDVFGVDRHAKRVRGLIEAAHLLIKPHSSEKCVSEVKLLGW